MFKLANISSFEGLQKQAHRDMGLITEMSVFNDNASFAIAMEFVKENPELLESIKRDIIQTQKVEGNAGYTRTAYMDSRVLTDAALDLYYMMDETTCPTAEELTNAIYTEIGQVLSTGLAMAEGIEGQRYNDYMRDNLAARHPRDPYNLDIPKGHTADRKAWAWRLIKEMYAQPLVAMAQVFESEHQLSYAEESIAG